MWLMNVVQCSQPAARSLAGHPVNDAISRAQDWCLLMAYCHSTSAIARPTLAISPHYRVYIWPHPFHLGHFVPEPRNDQGKKLVALQRTAHLIYLIIKILCWGHVLVIRYRTHLHIFCQFWDIHLYTLSPNTFLTNFSCSFQIFNRPAKSLAALPRVSMQSSSGCFPSQKIHNQWDNCPSSQSFWVVPERGYGTAAVPSWWNLQNVQNHLLAGLQSSLPQSVTWRAHLMRLRYVLGAKLQWTQELPVDRQFIGIIYSFL